MKTLRSISTTAMIAAVLFAFSSCEKEDMNPDPDGPAAGSFAVKMTDAPGDYDALDVEITNVEAYLEGSGWISLNNEVQAVSVLDLTNGAETQLAYQGDADAGVYSKVRITFGNDNSLSFDSGTDLGFDLGGMTGGANATIDLNWANSGSHQVIIDIDKEVSADVGAEILLDFHVMESVIQNGQQFVLNPTISLIEDASTGVHGKIEGAESAAVQVTDGNNSFSSYTDASGQFLVRGMQDGTYTVTLMPSQQGHGMLDHLQDQTIEGVVVAQGRITQMGTIQF
ncbi:MAG: DUF4382 domain-containing protein [Flavobacteriales bacterium]|nr:DUF4382 domain-containing protein [Flavobacteriales bacterium]